MKVDNAYMKLFIEMTNSKFNLEQILHSGANSFKLIALSEVFLTTHLWVRNLELIVIGNKLEHRCLK